MKKLGRPKKDNIKDYMLRIRMDNEELTKLDYLADKENISRSEFVRKLIENEYSIKFKEV